MSKFILLMVICSGIPGNACKPISTQLQNLILTINVFILVMTIQVSY